MAKPPASKIIPRDPTVVFCGKLQSREFTDGAYELADLLCELPSTRKDHDDDEHRIAAALAERIAELLDSSGAEFRAGAIAALAHRLVIDHGDSARSLDSWIPLNSIWDGLHGFDEPHPLALLFDVAGAPVSVTPDHVALKWGADEPDADISIEIVRAIGKPISRKRFAYLRTKETTR